MNGATVYKNARVNGRAVDLTVVDGRFAAIGQSAEAGIDLGGRGVAGYGGMTV